MGANNIDAEFQQAEEETLNVQLHCFECGTPVRFTLETPIGIGGYDETTPVALCGAYCAKRNADRIARLWCRCTCGAIVAPDDLITQQGGSIVGCPACRQQGEPLLQRITVHFWATHGSALCARSATDPSEGVVLSIRRSRVNCPACLKGLIIESERTIAAAVLL